MILNVFLLKVETAKQAAPIPSSHSGGGSSSLSGLVEATKETAPAIRVEETKETAVAIQVEAAEEVAAAIQVEATEETATATCTQVEAI